jgi:hypothetical protein
VSSWYAFDRFRTLVGPIQKADEEHGSPPFSNSQMAVAKTTRSLLMRRTTQYGEDNTMQCSAHAERATDSEAQEFSNRLVASRPCP